MLAAHSFADMPASLEALLDPSQGWAKIGEGYWQRTLDEGRTQTIAFGRAGMARSLEKAKNDLLEMVDLYLRSGDNDLQRALEGYSRHIENLEALLKQEEVATDEIPMTEGTCDTDWTARLYFYANCEARAYAYADYHAYDSECLGPGDLYTYAYARMSNCGGPDFTDWETCTKNDTYSGTCTSWAILPPMPIYPGFGFTFRHALSRITFDNFPPFPLIFEEDVFNYDDNLNCAYTCCDWGCCQYGCPA
jgi:hypothetical protein